MNPNLLSSVAALSVVLGLATASRAVGQAKSDTQPSLPTPQVDTAAGTVVTAVKPKADAPDAKLSPITATPDGIEVPETVTGLGESAASAGVEVPDLKGIPGTQVPEEVKALANDFKAQAQAFLDKQREISKKLKGATPAERELIKEQLKASRAIFLEQNTEIRNELKRRVLEMRSELVDARSQVSGASEGGTKPGRRGD